MGFTKVIFKGRSIYAVERSLRLLIDVPPHLSLFPFFLCSLSAEDPGSSFCGASQPGHPGVTAPVPLSWPVSLVNWHQRRVSVHPKLHGACPFPWRLGRWQPPPTSISSWGNLRTVVTETHLSSASLGWNTSPHSPEEARLLPSCWLLGQVVREDGRSGDKLGTLPLFTSFQNNELWRLWGSPQSLWTHDLGLMCFNLLSL